MVVAFKLGQAYWKQGFFNARREFDRYIGVEGPIEIRIPGHVIAGRIDRKAQRNGTARIMGGTELRDYFQKTFSLGDEVEVEIVSPTVLLFR